MELVKAPFQVGRPVEDEYFIDRERELEELARQTNSMSSVCLLGPRRMGKTSILLKLARQVKDPIPVYVNCYGVPDKRQLASILSDAVKDAYVEKTGDGKYGSAIIKYLKEGMEKIPYHVAEMDVSMGQYFKIRIGITRKEIEPDTVLADAFGYAEKLGAAKGKRFAIILDEIQDVGSRWGEDFFKRLRSIVEKQKSVCYVFCGSSITFMNSLVDDRASPFYRQLYKIAVGPLPEDGARKFVEERFSACGYEIENGAMDAFIETTRSIPDYVQRLGLIASTISRKITKAVVEDAYEKMLLDMDSEFRETLSKLNQRSGIYGAILTGLSRSDSLSEAGRAVGYDIGKAMRQMAYLQNVGLVEKKGHGKYAISDPIFNEWLKRNFGG